jgi:hypothetical protein
MVAMSARRGAATSPPLKHAGGEMVIQPWQARAYAYHGLVSYTILDGVGLMYTFQDNKWRYEVVAAGDHRYLSPGIAHCLTTSGGLKVDLKAYHLLGHPPTSKETEGPGTINWDLLWLIHNCRRGAGTRPIDRSDGYFHEGQPVRVFLGASKSREKGNGRYWWRGRVVSATPGMPSVGVVVRGNNPFPQRVPLFLIKSPLIWPA